MKKTRKKGERDISLGAQERSVLISAIDEYLDTHKKDIKTNHIIRRSCTYLNKIMSKLLRKKRCTHCGVWI